MQVDFTHRNQTSKIDIAANTTVSEAVQSHFKDMGIIACTINNISVDMSTVIGENSLIALYDFESTEGKHVFWHSSAHVLGNALVNLYNCKLVNGPPVESGFYYDVDIDRTLGENDFKDINKEMLRIVSKKNKFIKKYHKKEELQQMYGDNECKMHFINRITDSEISVYYNEPTKKTEGEKVFHDMCMGPHLENSSLIRAIKVTKSSSCYFLNDSNNKSLQRVYAISFPSKDLMKEYDEQIKRSKEMDHRKIGRELDLFFFHDYSPGSCFWLSEGAVIYNRLTNFLRGEYINRGFKEVITPNMFHTDLWKESGHYQNYKENIYAIEGEEFALKPMNCPGHCVMFRSTERSYKELPLRLADFGVLHRNECSGSLTGLTRVRRFQQDDAHIFCAKKDIKAEIESALGFLRDVYTLFSFKYELFLSTRPEKFLGEIAEWDLAEQNLKEAILDSGHTYTLNEGDGAFYGPKIDIILYDAFNRKTQCATIQLDFQLPQRFKLKFKNDLSEYETPVMIHRAILGSIERFIAILIESYGKNLPFWLAPRQVALLSVDPEADEYLNMVESKLVEVAPDIGIRRYTESKDTLNKKVRKAVTDGCKVVCILGKKEISDKEINVKFKEGNKNFKLDDFIQRIERALERKEEVNFDQ